MQNEIIELHITFGKADWWPWLLEVMLPSLPPTFAAISGFFIFHLLALKRQRREETRQACEAFKEEFANLIDIVSKCWEYQGCDAI